MAKEIESGVVRSKKRQKMEVQRATMPSTSSTLPSTSFISRGKIVNGRCALLHLKNSAKNLVEDRK